MSFNPGIGANAERCLNITIINDGVREDINEEFTLVLSTGDSDINLFPATAQVLVIDNDSEQNIYFTNISLMKNYCLLFTPCIEIISL